jgi:dTDP-4-amino-4,6-dideoxygalactose transaminase
MLLHRATGMPDASFHVAVRMFEETLSLPIYPSLSEEHVGAIINATREIFG